MKPSEDYPLSKVIRILNLEDIDCKNEAKDRVYLILKYFIYKSPNIMLIF